MKVTNNVGPNLNGVDATKNKTDELKSNSRKSAGPESTDIESSAKVDVSPRAQMMNKAKAIASEQTVDEAKVERLQKLIDSGQYKVDAEAVAGRLVDEHLLFPSE